MPRSARRTQQPCLPSSPRSPTATRAINACLDEGTDARQLQAGILDALRRLLLIQTGISDTLIDADPEDLPALRSLAERIPTPLLVGAMHRFGDARPSAEHHQPALAMELALVESLLASASASAAPAMPQTPGQGAVGQSSSSTVATQRPAAHATAPPSSPSPVSPLAAASTPPSTARASQSADTPSPGPLAPSGDASTLATLRDRWPAIVDSVARADRNTAALLKDCRPVDADEGSITLGFFYEFHCRRAAEPARRAAIAAAVGAAVGGTREVRCTVVPAGEADAARPRTKADHARNDPVVRHAIDALGARVAGMKPESEDP